MQAQSFDIIAMARSIGARGRHHRAGRVIGGVAALGLGAVRRGKLGWLLALGGVTLLWDSLRPERGSPSSSQSSDTSLSFGDGERDLVDEASWESFPASDPPAYVPEVVRRAR